MVPAGRYSRLTFCVGVRPKPIFASAHVHVTVVHAAIVAGEVDLALALVDQLLAKISLHGHTVAIPEPGAEDFVQMGAVGVAHAADNLTGVVAASGMGTGRTASAAFCFVGTRPV